MQVAVVAPIMVRHDAISLAARDTVRVLAADARFEARHFGAACDYDDIAHRRCHDVSDLLLDPAYLDADAAIFHFGIHHSLFDALWAAGPPVRIVRFHNVTPAEFVDEDSVPVIERSLRQIDTLRRADEIWADSTVNAEALVARGFDPARVRVIPLVVEDPRSCRFTDKSPDTVEILFVGRFARSKGLHDLIPAIARMGLPRGAVRVTLAGNTAWSNPAYLALLRDLIDRHDLNATVRFAGTVADAERERLFHAAHIMVMPSYHEGFCRPVIEGMRAGCVPVVYDAYNLPHIAAGFGRVVPAGDVAGLAAVLTELAGAIPGAIARPAEARLPVDRGLLSADDFALLTRRYADGFSLDAIGSEIKQRLIVLAGDRRHPLAAGCLAPLA
jgi:glycosyltransferase involved in cell wall biosynthesis